MVEVSAHSILFGVYCRFSEILRIVKEGRVFLHYSRFIIHLTILSVYEIIA